MSPVLTRQTLILVALTILGHTVRAGVPSIQWGGQQNGIKLGVAVLQGFGANGELAIYATPATNYPRNLVVPKLSQAFEVVLRDTGDNVIEPKAGAPKLGEPVQSRMPGSLRIRRELRFIGQEDKVLGGVKIDDVFLISEPKDYELQITIRMLKEEGSELRPVVFTPIKMKLHLVANELKLLRREQ
jgi:hypothetical protein